MFLILVRQNIHAWYHISYYKLSTRSENMDIWSWIKTRGFAPSVRFDCHGLLRTTNFSRVLHEIVMIILIFILMLHILLNVFFSLLSYENGHWHEWAIGKQLNKNACFKIRIKNTKSREVFKILPRKRQIQFNTEQNSNNVCFLPAGCYVSFLLMVFVHFYFVFLV